MYHVSEPIGALEQGPLLNHEPTTKRALVLPKGQSITITSKLERKLFEKSFLFPGCTFCYLASIVPIGSAFLGPVGYLALLTVSIYFY